MQTVNPQEVGVDPQRVERLFSAIERKINDGWLYGGAFFLARRGKIVAARNLGQSEPKNNRTPKPDRIFSCSSTSKQSTAPMLLMKGDRGEVGICDKVGNYSPEFPATGKLSLPIAQVLTQPPGFPNLAPDWPMPKWADWDA